MSNTTSPFPSAHPPLHKGVVLSFHPCVSQNLPPLLILGAWRNIQVPKMKTTGPFKVSTTFLTPMLRNCGVYSGRQMELQRGRTIKQWKVFICSHNANTLGMQDSLVGDLGELLRPWLLSLSSPMIKLKAAFHKYILWNIRLSRFSLNLFFPLWSMKFAKPVECLLFRQWWYILTF